MPQLRWLAVFTLCFAAPLAAYGNTFSSVSQYSDEREQFNQAKKALAKGNRTQFQILKAELKDYPLLPYLEYAELSSRLSISKEKEINQFLQEYGDSAVGKRMRSRWLEYLRKRDKSETYLKYYSDGNTSQQCYQALAQYRNGNKTLGIEQGLRLWNVGKSQPKGCDKLFHILISNDLVSEEIAWQRYQKAIASNTKRLTRYLKRFFVSPEYKTGYKNYAVINRYPARLKDLIDFSDNSEPNRAVVTRALKLLAKQDPSNAHRQWRYVRDKFDFSTKQQQTVQTALIKNLLRKGHVQQADAILENNKATVSADLFEWRLREALASSDWPNVRYWIKTLPEELATEQRWRYWLARAETGMTEGKTLAEHPLVKTLATERGFYSFIAADELQQPYSMEYQPSEITPELVSKIETNTAIVRARELYLTGDNVSAVREWSYAGQAFNAEEWEAAGVAFYEWGWHHISIISMVRARAWQDIVIRFPVLHEEEYRKYASKHDLDTELLMAITRQESAFNVKAVSPSNAKGLMQLLPSTAKYIAKKGAIPYSTSTELLAADKNIALGSAYYKYLMEKFDNNRVVSTASYNAGPGRVGKWLKESNGNVPIDIWIETIPYSETRRYVQNVLAFSVIYAKHLGEEAQLFTYNERKKLL